MHRLVPEDARSGLGEVALAEERYGTEIGADGALLQAGREPQHVGLVLEPVRGELVLRFRFDRLAAELADRLGERVGVLLMVPLELARERQYGLFEETALCTDLVSGDRLELRGKGGVEDPDVACFRAARLLCQDFTTRKQGDCRAGEKEA